MSERAVPPLAARKRVLTIVGAVASGLMVVFVLTIVGFIVQSRLAHDEERCPFEEGERRRIAEGVHVREQWRSCQQDVQERRWVIEREGEKPREFARRRLNAKYFADERYRWKVRSDAVGHLILVVQNDGMRPIEVLEEKLLEQ